MAPVDQELIEPFRGPLDAVVRPPGSKSLTNRALVCASLAEGTTVLTGALYADDTEAMLHCVHGLGAQVQLDRAHQRVVVTGLQHLLEHFLQHPPLAPQRRRPTNAGRRSWDRDRAWSATRRRRAARSPRRPAR